MKSKKVSILLLLVLPSYIFEKGKEEIVEVDFMDFVYCKEIKFSGRLKHVKIIIEDVYPEKKIERYLYFKNLYRFFLQFINNTKQGALT